MKWRLFVALVLGTVLSACGGSSSSSTTSPTSPAPTPTPTPSSATMFEGTIAGSGGQSGTLAVTILTAIAASSPSSFRSISFTINPLSVSQASGSLVLAEGGTVALTGTFDSATNGVTLSGGGFTFTGAVSGGVLSGTYTGPTGSSGGFSSLNATQNSVTAYCGTFTVPLPGDSGIWNMEVSATGTVSGVAYPTTATGGSPDSFTGQLNGNNLSITSSAKGNTGTGTIQNGTVNGTLAATSSHGAGTFTGSNGTCTVPTPPSPNLGTYTINVNVTGSGGAVSVCVSYTVTLNGATMPDPCRTIPIGQTGQILALATPGTNYTVAVPAGQSGPSCSVTSGGSGVFGPSMATVVVSCTGGGSGGGGGSIVVRPGTWSYVISANVPLDNQATHLKSCLAPNSSGTTAVSSSGTFSIPFSGLACVNCAMSGTITGTIVPTGVSGSVTASISGSGCSVQQPTPSPAAMVGTCVSTGCFVGLSSQDSFGLTFALTPP